MSDIVQIAGKPGVDETSPKLGTEAKYLKPEDRRSKYYFRIHTEDSPGILSIISGVFGKHGISIASVIQKEVSSKYVPLIFMTHEAAEDRVMLAKGEINDFSFVNGDVVMIRVEDTDLAAGKDPLA